MLIEVIRKGITGLAQASMDVFCTHLHSSFASGSLRVMLLDSAILPQLVIYIYIHIACSISIPRLQGRIHVGQGVGIRILRLSRTFMSGW